MNRKIIGVSFFILIICLCLISTLIYRGDIWLNNLYIGAYPVRGIDVSGHQGRIDWDRVKNSGECRFVFIKATEGRDFTDKQFKRNWEETKRVGIKHGAYHFFTFRSSGKDQASHFIHTVPKEPGSLPPVIDLEFSGQGKMNPPKRQVQKELNVFIAQVKSYYGAEPIIYVMRNCYDQYLINDYQTSPIWFSNILWKPNIGEKRAWTFWQYSNRGKINGIQGFVDLNVYRGDIKALGRE